MKDVIAINSAGVINIDYTAVAVNSSATTKGQWYRCVSTTDCHIAIGDAAIATVNHSYLPADTVEEFFVHEGNRISAIRNSVDGRLSCTPIV